MRRWFLLMIILMALTLPVRAMDFQPPPAPEEVAELIPETADSFGEGLWNVVRWAISKIDGSLQEAMGLCLSCLAVVIFSAILGEITTSLPRNTIRLTAAITVSGFLLSPSASLIRLGMDTARQISEYGKLLLPVMTGALAAQGGVSSGAALYAASAMFNSMLSALLSRLLVPMLYLLIALGIAEAVMGTTILAKLRDLLRWCAQWVLKIMLYLFTGYITVTGVISGSADAAAVRAARITISSAVPVVGGILADASEAVMISAGTLGSGAGIYGLITVLALFAGPFVRIGVQYLLLKATGALCDSIDSGAPSAAVGVFSGVMGLLLAMVSTQTALLLISTLCFLKGVS